MICNNCGKENGDNAKFCYNCGAPVTTKEPVRVEQQSNTFSSCVQPNSIPANNNMPNPMATPNQSPKKTNVGLIIGIVILVVILFVGAIGGIGWFVFNYVLNKKEVIEEDDDFVVEESEEETEEETEEPVIEIVVDKQEIFTNYIQEELQKEFGVIDRTGKYEAVYLEKQNDDYIYPEQFLEPMSGIVTTKIADFDVDGEEELLVVMLKNNEIYYRMYEAEGDIVSMQDEFCSYDGRLGFYDSVDWNLYMAGCNGQFYFIENSENASFVVADGVSYTLAIVNYNGYSFEEVASQKFMGSEFSDLEDAVTQFAEQVSEIGFTSSAASMNYELKFDSKAENAETILKVTGCNEVVRDPNRQSYYETGDVADLGAVVYRFMEGSEADNDTTDSLNSMIISGYDVQLDNYSEATRSGSEINAYIEYPVFSGTDSAVINWMNDHMKIWAEEYQNSLKMEDMIKDKEEMQDETPWDYGNTNIDTIYYDDEYASVALSWHWYVGGVSNGGWKTANFDLKNMKYLTLSDVLGKDYDEISEDILAALAKEYDLENDSVKEALTDKTEYTFSFDEDTVTVYFESYELNQGGWYMAVTLPRN